MKQERSMDKYTRLLDAGAKVIHEQGFHKTLLTDIAREAEVPLGSIYYYFKTKDDLAEAVIDKRVKILQELTEKFDTYSDPKKRLSALIQVWVDDSEIDSRYGCPIGSLCYELAKNRGQLSDKSAEMLKVLVEWCGLQFREMKKSVQKANELAFHLMCALQGASLLANSIGDEKIILNEAKHLNHWLNNL